MKAIIEKELRSYFSTARGYVFIGVFLLIAGYFFITYNVLGGNSDVGVMLENTVISFILLIPVLTMGLFAGEKKSGTDALYLSAPLSKWEIVIGKYIAATIVFLCAIIINSFSAFVMIAFRGQTFGEVVAIYAGFALLGMAFIAAGMFISALTENQIVSAIISLCVCFTLYLSDWLLNISANDFVKMLALPSYYSKFLVGIFDIQAVLYFLSFAAVFILLTILYLERIEVKAGGKKDMFIISVCILASFFLFNYSADKLSGKVQMTFDMSKNAIFDLTEETQSYLDSMEEEVTMYYLGETNNENPYIVEVLERYGRAADKLTLKTVDLIKNPSFTSKYVKDNEAISKGSIIVESSKRFTVVEPEASFHISRGDDGNVSRELGFSLETMLTQAIDYVLSDKTSTVVWLTGHGEMGYEKPAALLRSENMQVEYSDSVDNAVKVADLIVIFSPAADISENEYNKLKSYLESGGKLFMALNPGFEATWLKQLGADYGMSMQDTVLTVDNISDIIQGNRLYLMAYPTAHKITEGYTGNRNLLFPVASPIITGGTEDAVVTRLAVTDQKTAERNVNQDTLGEKLSTGVFTVAAISENAENGSRVLLSSSSQHITPADSELGDVLNAFNYSNKDFFIRSVKYMIDHEDNLLVAPKSIMSRSLNLNVGTQTVLIAIFGVMLPLLAFVLGFMVFKRRRNR